MKRMLSLLISIMILISVTACSNQKDSKGDQKDTISTEYSGQLPLTQKREKLTFMTHSGANAAFVPPSIDVPVYKRISEITNVDIDWQVTDNASYAQTVSVMLAAGQNLPDIIHLQGQNVDKLGEDGVIIPLDGLVEKNAPHYKRFFNTQGNELYKTMMTSADGKIYAMRGTILKDTLGMSLLYNKVWMEKLNIKTMPNTLDEFYSMLSAFKSSDLNGNGNKDEIPLVAFNNGIGIIGYAFGLQEGYQVDSNGKVTADVIDIRYKEYLGYLNKLYSEGLLDNQYLSNNANTFQERAGNNTAGVITFWGTYAGRFSGVSPLSQDKNGNQPVFVQGPPLKGPRGDQYFINRYGVADPVAISKDCKNKDLAMKLIDYLFNGPEALDLQGYGIEGVTYKKVNGKIELIQPKESTWQEALQKVGGAQPPYAHQQLLEHWKYRYPSWVFEYDAQNKKYYKDPTMPDIAMTVDENAKWTSISRDVNTYLNEMKSKFITGKEPLAKFDEYVSNLKKMGMDELIKIKQQMYNRYKSIK